jgi:rhodanese-related sulfurtransferase
MLKYRVLFPKGRRMPAPNAITVEKLAKLIGTPNAPLIVDVSEPRSASPSGLIPGSIRKKAGDVAQWAPQLPRSPVVVACSHGQADGPGVAAWLRQAGIAAEQLEGGRLAWSNAGQPLIADEKLPPRDAQGRTVWVTRQRPKVDRVACPWLIRRFVDPMALFLFVAPSEVLSVADRFDAAPFDVEGVFWSHRSELCTFDVMVEELGLAKVAPLASLATIVRGADTAHPEIAPQAAGLLAMSLGLSRMFSDDLEQLEAGMLIYDALYRWCRDAVNETHDWVSHQSKARQPA